LIEKASVEAFLLSETGALSPEARFGRSLTQSAARSRIEEWAGALMSSMC